MNPRSLGPALLFCPGDRGDRFRKALDRSDTTIFDLEDAVGHDRKEYARAAVAAFVRDVPDSCVVRINAPDTPWFEDDVTAMREAQATTLMLPKASHTDQLRLLSDFDVIALCETARGVLAAQELATAPNCVGLMWGGEDLIADTGGRSSRGADGRYYRFIEHARSTVLLAAAAARVQVVDAVHIDITDVDGLRRESAEAADLGFTAKACIHPGHVEVIRNHFRPSDTQISWAHAVLENPEAATNGVFRHGDQMIDGPLLSHARTIVERTNTCTSI